MNVDTNEWSAPTQEIVDLAAAFGVATEFYDQSGNFKQISAETLDAILAALNLDVTNPKGRALAWDRAINGPWRLMLPHVVVARLGAEKDFPIHIPDGSPLKVWVELETGEILDLAQVDRYVEPRAIDGTLIGEATFAVPTNLPLGWHTIHASSEQGAAPDLVSSATLVVTPDYLELPTQMRNKRTWGLMSQLYATRSADSWGLGDLNDLATLATWGGSKGAGYVLVNPMHAAEVAPPMAPSPYLPATRRYFNPIYLHIEDIPEYSNLDAASKATIAELATPCKAMNTTAELLDRDTVWAAKKQSLELLLAPKLSAARQSAFDAFVGREGEGLQLFATWCAFAEKYGIVITEWPEGLRTPRGHDVVTQAEAMSDRIELYKKLQWLLDEQFASAQAAAKAAGMNAGIVHDLAVGVHPEGADAWALQDVLAQNVSVGAPPDMFNQMGQDWSQPPWRPDALVEAAYIPYRDMLRTILRHAGGIRVDHALGLFRLWWVPKGMTAAGGTFVKYDHEAMVGILALEAHRAGAFVVGEDLGTVERWILEYLNSRGILGTSILWFEHEKKGGPLAPDKWRELCLGTVTVHDIPPTAGFIDGEHIRMRQDLGLLTTPVEKLWEDHKRELAAWRKLLTDSKYLESDPTKTIPAIQLEVEALHRVLADTPCQLVAVAVPDLVGDMRAQNQPGTDQEYPNWRIPTCRADGTPLLIEDLTSNPAVALQADRLISAVTKKSSL
ncbi:MAG: hypothetical protein RLZZ426_761 [Actinomycetota bacterium]